MSNRLGEIKTICTVWLDKRFAVQWQSVFGGERRWWGRGCSADKQGRRCQKTSKLFPAKMQLNKLQDTSLIFFSLQKMSRGDTPRLKQQERQCKTAKITKALRASRPRNSKGSAVGAGCGWPRRRNDMAAPARSKKFPCSLDQHQIGFFKNFLNIKVDWVADGGVNDFASCPDLGSIFL